MYLPRKTPQRSLPVTSASAGRPPPGARPAGRPPPWPRGRLLLPRPHPPLHARRRRARPRQRRIRRGRRVASFASSAAVRAATPRRSPGGAASTRTRPRSSRGLVDGGGPLTLPTPRSRIRGDDALRNHPVLSPPLPPSGLSVRPRPPVASAESASSAAIPRPLPRRRPTVIPSTWGLVRRNVSHGCLTTRSPRSPRRGRRGAAKAARSARSPRRGRRGKRGAAKAARTTRSPRSPRGPAKSSLP